MNLDLPHEYKKYDPGGVSDSVRLFADQLAHGWSEVNRIVIPDEYKGVGNVVLSGMGGSGLGGRVIKALFRDKMSVSFEVSNEYSLPNYVNENSLVILSSYSGNTEETIFSAEHAIKKNAKIIGIATGGELEKFLIDNNLPFYKIKPKYNPSKQPRMALGYSVSGILGIMRILGFIEIDELEFEDAVKSTRKYLSDWSLDKLESENLAKSMARSLFRKAPILVASEHLVGATHCMKNQLNESSKTFSAEFVLPELNHHLMEGLRNPALIKEHLIFLMFESELYFERIKRRYQITKKVIEENEVSHVSYFLRSETKLAQTFEVLAFGGFVSFYLSMLYQLNPSDIPWVDYFKQKLNEG